MLTPDCQRFIDKWNSGTPYIEAHTSGSTGNPKLIYLSRRLIEESAQRSIRHFGLNADSHIHVILSPEYIAGKMAIIRAILSGAELSSEEPSSLPLSGADSPDRITLLSAVGSQIEGLYNLYQHDSLPEIQYLLLGGAPLNADMRKKAVLLADTVWESYGMTETASHVALRMIDKNSPNVIQRFRPLDGITTDVDPRGCLVLELPAAGRIITNDLVEMYSDGSFLVSGRVDNVIITGGLKVVPEQVESILSPIFPPDCTFIIASRPHIKWGQEVILAIEDNSVSKSVEIPPDKYYINDRSLKAYCEELLPTHQRPRAVLKVPEIKRTSTGKIIRKLI